MEADTLEIKAREEAARRNYNRSQEERNRNLAYKVVRKRESKREILAPLMHGEFIRLD